MSKHHRPFRHLTERILNAVLSNGAVADLSYRLGGTGTVRVTRQVVDLGPERRPAQPLRIGFASDFHAGPTTPSVVYDDLLRCVREEAPDVLLLGGDYVSFCADNVAQLKPFLAGLRAPLGVYAVIGNHDIWNGRGVIEDALRATGVQVLVNRSVALPAPFGHVSVCGIDDPWLGRPSGPDAFAGAGDVRIYLMHSPDGLRHVGGERFDVGFAGHTHGGQIARPDGVPLFRPKGRFSRLYCYGRFDLPGHGPLLVSRGVGCSAIPLRVNADPELLICTLR
ncbi:metallophosphoesterase [Massilia pinisoli]|uniref:Metallophosphoesterase n=1 Tax=Massilia pinisoli TaxID=1772194 RepID=A0ABT1ZKC4_9BURK|nr:metallophosphoesterase [Massilia pinisoli]MCS0580352.1 metallophosphoesterase [Massilia pinisoli]